MPKTISAALEAHLAEEVTTLATCWRVTRRDGLTHHFTDHDRDLVVDGATYRAATGYTRSAVSSDTTLAVDNLEIDGLLDAEEITEADLRGGRFDYAAVEMFLVNWADPGQGKLILRKGWLGEVTVSRTGVFHAELRGLAQALQQRIGELYAPECRADLGDARCKVPLWPDELQRRTTYKAGDVVRVITDPSGMTGPLAVDNPSFESGDLSGWTVVSGGFSVLQQAGNPPAITAYDGDWFLHGTKPSPCEARQDADLTSQNVSGAHIDAGQVTLTFSCRRGNAFADDTGRVIVEALDAGLDVVGTLYDSGDEAFPADGVWRERGFTDVTLPAGARALRIRLIATLVAGSNANAVFDDVRLSTVDAALASDTSAKYENLIYECTIAGTTAAVQPVYDTTPGNPTMDGSAEFTARAAHFMTGEVVSVADRRTFTSDVTGVADGWFGGGLLVWETGANAATSAEVKAHTADVNGDTFELFLPAPFAIGVGDVFRVHPGCDKRLDTCRDKFANVINFRGEPYVPGHDDYLDYPDAR